MILYKRISYFLMMRWSGQWVLICCIVYILHSSSPDVFTVSQCLVIFWSVNLLSLITVSYAASAVGLTPSPPAAESQWVRECCDGEEQSGDQHCVTWCAPSSCVTVSSCSTVLMIHCTTQGIHCTEHVMKSSQRGSCMHHHLSNTPVSLKWCNVNNLWLL